MATRSSSSLTTGRRDVRRRDTRHGLDLSVGTTVLPHHAIVPTECPGTLDLERIVREAEEEDDMWLARAIRSVFPHADVSGPDVESGQPFKG
jgi:hypothetical protein